MDRTKVSMDIIFMWCPFGHTQIKEKYKSCAICAGRLGSPP